MHFVRPLGLRTLVRIQAKRIGNRTGRFYEQGRKYLLG